jgi:Mg2+/Co2+ transporter CorB
MSTYLVVSLILLVFLIILSGVFSASETAMMALNRYRLKHLIRQKNKRAIQAHHLLKRPDRLLGVILLGNTFSNIFASSLATLIAGHFFGEAGVLGVTILLTCFILIFSEVLPKTLAALRPEGLAFGLSPFLKILQVFLYPIVFILNFISNGILKSFGINLTAKHSEPLSQEEIRSLVHDAKAKLHQRQHHMLLGVLDLENATISDVLTPRSKIYGINLNDSLPKIFEKLIHSPYSKIPVYYDNIDQIAGVLSLRKCAQFINQGPLSLKKLQSIIEPAYFVPEQISLQKLLISFQKKKEQFALIVNEYGDIEGLATLEDILEEIMGDYLHSLPSQQSIKKVDAHHYLVSGTATIRDINRQLDINLPSHGAKTLNGLIIEQLQSIPEEKTQLEIPTEMQNPVTNEPIKIKMEIEKAEDNTIEFVKIFV